jgi:hypothetical protein
MPKPIWSKTKSQPNLDLVHIPSRFLNHHRDTITSNKSYLRNRNRIHHNPAILVKA